MRPGHFSAAALYPDCTVHFLFFSFFFFSTKVQHQSLLRWWSVAILWGKQCERGKREALRWREILPRLKRMYAMGDDQMAEAEDRQQKERSNRVVRIEEWGVERDSEALKEWGRGWVLHGETSLGEWVKCRNTYIYRVYVFWAARQWSITFYIVWGSFQKQFKSCRWLLWIANNQKLST